MDDLRLNGKPAVKINGLKIREYTNCRGKKNILCDCEGDLIWFPSKHIKLNDDATILMEEWLYNAKVSKGEL